MPRILFDTSIYISALRRGDISILYSRRATRGGEPRPRPLWLSVAVLEKLLVGARDGRVKKLLARLERDFERAGRLLVPAQSDWMATGQVLSLIGEKYGYEEVERARMTNDALIAMSSSRSGVVVQTLNDGDYRKIAEFRPFEWEHVEGESDCAAGHVGAGLRAVAGPFRPAPAPDRQTHFRFTIKAPDNTADRRALHTARRGLP